MFRNRFFAPFEAWGHLLIRVARRNGGFDGFVRVFEENCRIAIEERIDSMKPDLGACNEVLEGCCRDLGSVADAERVVEIMSALGVPQDARSFGCLAYLYASKGLQGRLFELEKLMSGLGISDKSVLYGNLIGGYVRCRDFGSILSVILRVLREEQDSHGEYAHVFSEESYTEVVKCFVENGRIKELAGLVIESQQLESSRSTSIGIGDTVGYRIVNACVNLGLLDKAHSILDEMNARGACVGLGVYSSILKAYCKERRTAEAAQLVTEICAAGLQLDPGSYDALIDASMSGRDFQSAFSLFRDMREARLPDLKVSYLTIMTGLMENHRPELMAGFLDSVVDDPRVEVAPHDWNSIIHAFCKVGRLEDARRTYRRMVFLQFEPNEQTYVSLINGYVSAEKYFSVLILWTEVRRKGIKLDNALLDAFLYALVKGGFFDAAMQVVEKAQELKIFVDKWRHKQAFMENHKKLKVAKVRRRNFRKMEALIAFKNWAGLNG
uniref:Pentatricopeptide repeat-containing protein At1g69290 n=1 Tax=Anthurium amnicola TaxID=1678845 RepID=A0A1D1Z6U5_9ARAE